MKGMTKRNAIIYTTNTGSTEHDDRLLAHETGLPAYSLEEGKKKVYSGAEIVYKGWIMAGSVKDYVKAAKRYRVCAMPTTRRRTISSSKN